MIVNNNNFNFITGLQSFEDLNLLSSDRYQFILPYYNFDKQLFNDYQNGTINFGSGGSNEQTIPTTGQKQQMI